LTFAVQRDLGPAISGERLGPADTVACPRLPQIAALRQQVLQSHIGRLRGEPGSGKSISTYQLGHDLMTEGFHVLRVSEPPDESAALNSYISATYKSLFIVD